MKIIPWPGGPSWRQEVVIDNRVYSMRGRWNDVGGFWSFDLFTRDDVAIVTGAKIVLGVALFARLANELLPRGAFFVVTLDPSCPCEPGRDDMKNKARLVYVPII